MGCENPAPCGLRSHHHGRSVHGLILAQRPPRPQIRDKHLAEFALQPDRARLGELKQVLIANHTRGRYRLVREILLQRLHLRIRPILAA